MTERLSISKDAATARDGTSIAVFKGRSVLLVKRARPPFAGLWSLAGGKTEGAEAPRAKACLELMEETGIQAEDKGSVDIVWIAADEENGAPVTYRLTVFYGRHAGGSLKAGGDTEAAEWGHLDEIGAFPMPEGTAERIWRAARRLRRPWRLDFNTNWRYSGPMGQPGKRLLTLGLAALWLATDCMAFAPVAEAQFFNWFN